ncbi:MAG: DUF4301 family protein [Bacteroidales bacterium]|jgi:hypothetical protein|nr:DUF4301 family protein [Bacteroidales bacterium]
MEKLSTSDIALLKKKGISEKQLSAQLKAFKTGFPYISLQEAATVGNGKIISFSQKEIDRYVDFYDEMSSICDIQKFVPASGAATRMFKSLFAYYDELKAGCSKRSKAGNNECNKTGSSAKPTGEAAEFFKHIKDFPFYKELSAKVKDFSNHKEVLRALLEKENGLNYGSLPKGLLLFHIEEKTPVTAIEEHLMEAAEYAATKIHFTVSSEHLSEFKKKVKEVLPKYEKKFGIKYNITYSIQNPATDTVAVTLDNKIFRDEKRQIVFRPGGHGALIENVNALDSELVFIKNIDNITTSKKRSDTLRYKKLIGAYLIAIKDNIHGFLNDLSSKNFVESDIEAIEFFAERLFIDTPDKYKKFSFAEKKAYWKKAFNAPIRVCGMVKNEGEPGGGPFFTVSDSSPKAGSKLTTGNKHTSLQIVESSQIDLKNAKQKAIFEQSTHFNPVDLACWIRDYKGKKFDLKKYIDPSTAFITEKSVKGKNIKAMELPGLWNGAMAKWITCFVETPISVFTPVKTVTDLLRPAHQG